jgi:hypothetical protein
LVIFVIPTEETLGGELALICAAPLWTFCHLEFYGAYSPLVTVGDYVINFGS